MLKQPAPSMPGMTDTLDFVKNLWGSMNIPGANMPGMSALGGPPLSVEDLDKRIADMKAVESWLNLNLTMLRGTIQALEVQRGTLVTLRSMGSSMAEALRQSGVSAEKMGNMPFAAFFGQPGQGAVKPPAAPAANPPGPAGGGSAQPGAGAAPGAQSSAQASAPFDPAAAANALGMPAAMAWWNMLQDQFTQAVTTAMTPAPGSAPAPAPAAKSTEGAQVAAGPEIKPEQAPAAPSEEPAAGNGNGRARGGRPKADKA